MNAVDERTVPSKAELRELIRAAFSGNGATPEPRLIAEQLLAELSDEMYAAAARWGLEDIIAKELREERNRAMNGRPHRSAKFEARAQAASERPDIFSAVIVVGYQAGERNGFDRPIRKYLGECTKRDLLGAAEIDAWKVQGMERRIGSYRTLARKLKGEQRVNELERRIVEHVFEA
jgi:hypothetical protein